MYLSEYILKLPPETDDMSPIRPRPRAGLMSIQAYTPGKSDTQGVRTSYKLSSNESPIGASKHALDAYQASAQRIALYPDGSSHVLRAAIAAKYGLDENRVVCGAGSDELIRLLALAYLGPGDEGIVTTYGFQIFQLAILAAGGRPIAADEDNYTASVDNILASIGEHTRVVFLANPNNPTGTYLPRVEIERLVAALPSDILLVLDAAYSEYVTVEDYDDGTSLVDLYENIVVTRTFSKIFGLASLRVGWAYAPQSVCDVLHRIRGPFNVSGPSMAAAVASLEDDQHLIESLEHNEKWKLWLYENLLEIGLRSTPSITNFLLVHFPENGPKNALSAEAFLHERGIFVRNLLPYGLGNALRISIGNSEANIAAYSSLREFMVGT
jgi:histidinol-phosphate aminotransferase